ncbi:MAG: PH domain-containing protein [Clostridium perfringens]|nr:PH domain-containing protein [Clostridium perfringens]
MKTAEEMYKYCLENRFAGGINRMYGIKNFSIIEKELYKDEEVLMTFTGIHDYRPLKNYDGGFTYALTDRRIIMCHKNLVGKMIEQLKYDDLSNITFKMGIIYGVITIEAFKESLKIAVSKSESSNIFNRINEIVLDMKNKKSNENSLTENEKIIAVKLKGLKELLDMKVLSEDEFEKQKSELLAKL